MTLLEQDQKLQTETITPELIDYIVGKIITAVSPKKSSCLALLLLDKQLLKVTLIC